MQFHGRIDVGQLMSRASSDPRLVQHIIQQVLQEVAEAPFEIVVAVGFIIWTAVQNNMLPTLVLLVVGFPLFMCPVVLLSKRIRKWAKKALERYSVVGSRIHEILTCVRVVKAYDTALCAEVELPADAVILAAGIAPGRENKENLAKMVKVPISKDGYYFEAHQKLRPVDFATEGVYVAGAAHWPKFMDECIAQASGAASRMLTVISKDKLISEGIVASANHAMCDGCGVCVGCCDYNAITLIEVDGKLKSNVNAGLCKGCGCCVASCPAGAMEQKGFKCSQIIAEIDACLDYPVGGE